MGLFVSDSPSGTINLADPIYDLVYTAQTPVNSYEKDRYETTAAYVQDQATYGRLHLTAGLRLTSLGFLENSDVGVANDTTYTHLSPRIGATLDVAHGVALYAGYATAFRAPFGFIGRQAPQPETSRNVEGGVKLALPNPAFQERLRCFARPMTTSSRSTLTTRVSTCRVGGNGPVAWRPTWCGSRPRPSRCSATMPTRTRATTAWLRVTRWRACPGTVDASPRAIGYSKVRRKEKFLVRHGHHPHSVRRGSTLPNIDRRTWLCHGRHAGDL